MNSSFRNAVRAICPPLLADCGRKLFCLAAPQAQSREAQEWTYVPGGWEQAESGGRGWNAQGVADTLVRTWPDFVDSIQVARPFSLSNEAVQLGPPDIGFHNTVMTFAYVLARAASERRSVSVLDWGGGLGHYNAVARVLFPELDFRYVCMELPAICTAGRRLQPDVEFVSDEQACLSLRYDLVMASSSLHYERDWVRRFGALARAAGRLLYVTRIPFVERSPSFVVLQRAQRYGYGTEYLGWCLNRTEFLAEARRLELHLVREFLVDEKIAIPGAPETANYRGFLFESDGNQPACD